MLLSLWDRYDVGSCQQDGALAIIRAQRQSARQAVFIYLVSSHFLAEPLSLSSFSTLSYDLKEAATQCFLTAIISGRLRYEPSLLCHLVEVL